MGSGTLYPFLLVLGLSLQHYIEAQDCKPPPRQDGDAFPDIWSLATESYQFFYEANYVEQKVTHYMTETYDKVNSRGRLDIEINGQKSKIVYFSKTDEIFEATDSSCDSKRLNSLDTNAFAEKYGGWNWVNKDIKETIVGPSNMFRRGLQDWNEPNSKIGKEKDQVKVRGMMTDVWTWCYYVDDKNKATVKLHFTDPKTENPYGLDGTVPVRVQVNGLHDGTQFTIFFEFIGLRVDLPAQELNDLISIPVSVGCERQVKGLPQPPNYEDKDMYLEAELVYTPIINNSVGFTYVSNYKIAIDQKNGLVAVQFAPWKSHKEAEIAEPGDEMFRVWDVTNGYIFNIDKTKGTCKIETIEEKFSSLTLPDGYKIDLGEGDIFVFDSSGEGYHYFQETIERGIPASVFEKRSDDKDDGDDLTLNELIVTRYHAANGTIVENMALEKNVPLKVVYWMYDFEPGKFMGSLVVNMYSYQSALYKRHEVFDVSLCFPEYTQSKWVQIVFPLNDYKTADLIPFIPFVVNEFPSLLGTFATSALPYRIPKLLMDVDQDNVYLTALILERPPFLLDFNVTQKTSLKASLQDKTELGVKTLEDCAKSCIESFCSYFSYCGALCTITSVDESSIRKDSIESRDGCALYDNNFEINPPTMDQMSSSLAESVAGRKITLPLSDPTGTKIYELTAELFRDDIAFGLQGLTRRPEGMEEDRFKAFKLGFKLKAGEADEGQRVGKMSFASCKQSCIDRDFCETVSYCLASQECFMSSKHAEEIADSSFEESTQCMVFGRTYQDRFRQFPGLMLNHDAEKMISVKSVELCAKACIGESAFGCKSFDFCPTAEKSCWLHKEHFTDVTEEQHVANTVECGHYSRRFIAEFTRIRHKDLSKRKGGMVIANVTSEQCAQLCRDSTTYTCQGFDHCSDPFSSASTCTLRDVVQTQDMTEQGRCDVFTRKPESTKGRIKREVQKENGHSGAATGGLGFTMLLIGAILGVGGVFGYGYYKANRANRN